MHRALIAVLNVHINAVKITRPDEEDCYFHLKDIAENYGGMAQDGRQDSERSVCTLRMAAVM